MDIRKLQRVIVEALEDVKGQDIRVFNSSGLTDLFDRVVIATGTSNRHTKALANSVRSHVKDSGGDVLSMEGEEGGEWVLVDLGDAIVHIMQGAIRSYYNLEEIWGDKPVSLKPSAGANASARRASAASDEPDDEVPASAAKKTARKSASKSAPSKSAPAKRVAVKAAAKRPATKRAPVKRSGA
jgi:ribosome-associated protein